MDVSLYDMSKTLDERTHRQLSDRCAEANADELIRLRAQFAGEALRQSLRDEDDATALAKEDFCHRVLQERTRQARKRALAAAKAQHEQWLANDGPRKLEERKRVLAERRDLDSGRQAYTVVRPGLVWGDRRLEIGDVIRPLDTSKARKLVKRGLLEPTMPAPEAEVQAETVEAGSHA